jgi:hypothetical protein
VFLTGRATTVPCSVPGGCRERDFFGDSSRD